ncbi:hypothetical protein [Natronorubrum bangense]|uniref:Uncharacterized protein n=2 Tax=Natronorubrum bangense TaxID=61858 RepID=L9WQ19_9EURY|nr:hypothetical protein [Natronorubrum bangense]ELY51482.1 hypothetical protein C494_04040 [Natronorubrum bangense JCM 10635]QCC54556.1 hypothetical protein DV706_08785 [Natronorubrum bangense]
MTPVALLVLFCAAMAAIAVGRLVVSEQREYVDIGTALVVVGITLLTTLWVALEESMLTTVERLLLAAVGVCVVAAGVVMIVRYWDQSAGPTIARE